MTGATRVLNRTVKEYPDPIIHKIHANLFIGLTTSDRVLAPWLDRGGFSSTCSFSPVVRHNSLVQIRQ